MCADKTNVEGAQFETLLFTYYQLWLSLSLSAYQEVGELEWEMFSMNSIINLWACVAEM